MSAGSIECEQYSFTWLQSLAYEASDWTQPLRERAVVWDIDA